MARKWWRLLTVCLGLLMLLVDITIVNVALPSIAGDLSASFSSLQWTIDAYALSLAALLLVSGSLGDRIGHRTVFAGGPLGWQSVVPLPPTQRSRCGSRRPEPRVSGRCQHGLVVVAPHPGRG
jgi:MFS family permease